MIRTLLATTALTALLTTAALAQATTTETPVDPNATTTEAPADPNAMGTETPADPNAMDTETPADPNAMGTETPADPNAMGTETPADPNATTTTDPADTTAMDAGDAMANDMNFDMTTGYAVVDTDDLATQIVGANVWSDNVEGSENIGSINDLVIDENGSVGAVIVGVGGFLGIGEKNVAVDWDEFSWEVAPDGNEVLVLRTTAEALTSAPAFVWEDDDNNPDAATGDAADPAATPVQ